MVAAIAKQKIIHKLALARRKEAMLEATREEMELCRLERALHKLRGGKDVY